MGKEGGHVHNECGVGPSNQTNLRKHTHTSCSGSVEDVRDAMLLENMHVGSAILSPDVYLHKVKDEEASQGRWELVNKQSKR
jgi:hypothetical protein